MPAAALSSRRHFLAAGATAALAIATPASLLAAPRHASSATLAADILAILDRPAQHYFDAPCDCAECVSLRSAPWSCTVCGYDGEPWVDPCHCREVRASNIDFCERILSGEDLPPAETTHDRWRRELEQLRASPDVRCHHGAPGRSCAHGASRWCPACTAVDGEVQEDVPERFVERLAAIRALLRDRGLA